MPQIQMTRLPNGLRVITDQVEGVHSTAIGIWTNVGTRNEDRAHNGAAHMVEHMLFKGTQKRNALQIAKVIENVGGHMNAYTARENTSYHIHLLKDDVPLALDVLGDMYQNATMPDDELARERHVILQEIGMCNDTPDDVIFDHYYERAYPDQALGAPILGRADDVTNMPRDVLMGYVQKYYTPAHTVISAAGALNHEDIVDQVATLFEGLPENTAQTHINADYQGGDIRFDRKLEQVHLVMGFEGAGRLSPDYYTAQVLAIILGGGMSSRLFQEVREKRGLAYSIYAFQSGYMDGGLFGIYTGTGANDLPTAIPVICDEILKVANTLTEEEITRAKMQLKSGMLMGRENMMSRADQQAKYLLARDKPLNIDVLLEQIEAVDQATISATARQIFASKPTVAALGPLGKLESFEDIQGRLVS